jgi:hypothetical protein
MTSRSAVSVVPAMLDNYEGASSAVPLKGGGSKFSVQGSMTGPSGETWNMTTAWGVDPDGLIRLITGTP